MSDEEKYYKKEKTVFVCRGCNQEWDVPGAAESCYRKHEIMALLEEVYNHKHVFLDEVMEDIREKVEEGEYDYDG